MPGCTVRVDGQLPSNFSPPLTGKTTLVQAVRIVQPAAYARTVMIESLRGAVVRVDAPTVQPKPSALHEAADDNIAPRERPIRDRLPDVEIGRLTSRAAGLTQFMRPHITTNNANSSP